MIRRLAVLLFALVLVTPGVALAAPEDGDQAAAAALPSGLVGYWPLSEGSGSAFADTSGNANHGTTNAAWTSGISGSALELGGSAVGRVPASPALEPQQLTLSAWVKASGTQGKWGSIVAKGETLCALSSWSLYTGSAAGLVFYVGGLGGAYYAPTVPATIWDGAWHHAVGTFDGATVRLYVDGAQVGSGTPASTSITYAMADETALVLGRDRVACPGAGKYNGIVDQVAVWNRALSAGEVQALGAGPTPTTTALESAPNPSTAGASVTLTATVTPSTATGTVTFTDVTGGGAVELGTDALADGAAALAVTFDTPGKRQIVATYDGATDFEPSTSSTLTQTVAAASLTPTTTTLAAVPNPIGAGSPSTLTATVTPIPTTGDIEWWIDGAKAATSPVGLDGKASINRTWADPGSHTVQAKFVEGTLYAPSQSIVTNVTVATVAYAVTLTATPAVVPLGTTTHLAAGVSPATAGSIKFYAGAALLGTQPITAGGQATWDPVVPQGSTQYRADFIPTGATTVGGSAAVTVQGKLPLTLDLTVDPSAVVSGEGKVTFEIWASDYDVSGAVDIWDVTATPAKVATTTLADGQATVDTRLPGTGTHSYEARFAGSTTHVPATSNTVTVDLAPDTVVSVNGLALQYGTFYPVKDGYRDTVAIKGSPAEPVTVTIKVKNSNGKTVRSWTLARRDTAWSVAWNGRNTGGTLQPAGKYKVTQTIKDVPGHTKTWTGYTVLSGKKLAWTTATITKNGRNYSSFNYSSYGWVLPSNKYSNGVNIYGNIYDEWAWVGYAFSVPKAIKYGTFKFSVLGTPQKGRGVPYISMWNYAASYEDAERSIGRTYSWYSTSATGSSHVSRNRIARGYVTVVGENWGWYDVAKVKLTYRYAVLR